MELRVVQEPRLAAFQVQGGVELPAFQQLSVAILAWNLITGRKSEAMPHVVIAAGVFRGGVQAVLWEVPETAQGTAVQGVSVRGAGGEVKSGKDPLCLGRFHAFVVGSALVLRPA